jgi:hypothetical protein
MGIEHGLQLHTEQLEGYSEISQDQIDQRAKEISVERPNPADAYKFYTDWLVGSKDRGYDEARQDLAITTNALISLRDEIFTNYNLAPSPSRSVILGMEIKAHYALAQYIERSVRNITGESPYFSEVINYLTFLTYEGDRRADKLLSRFDAMCKIRGSDKQGRDFGAELKGTVLGSAAVIECIDGGPQSRGISVPDLLADQRPTNPNSENKLKELYYLYRDRDKHISLLPHAEDDAYGSIDLALFLPTAKIQDEPENFSKLLNEIRDFRPELLCCQIKNPIKHSGLQDRGVVCGVNLGFDVKGLDNPDALPMDIYDEYKTTLSKYQEQGTSGFLVVAPQTHIKEGRFKPVNRADMQSKFAAGVAGYFRNKIIN